MQRVGRVVALRRQANGFVVETSGCDALAHRRRHRLAIGFDHEALDDLAVGCFYVHTRDCALPTTLVLHSRAIVTLAPERLVGASVYILPPPSADE